MIHPEEVLRNNWGITEPLQTDELGVNNTVWQVGNQYWLCRYETEDLSRCQREVKFYEALRQRAMKESQRWFFPEVVPVLSGELLLHTGDAIWRLTRHVPGQMPSPKQIELYNIIVAGLGSLHRMLRDLEVDMSVAGSTVLDDLSQNLTETLTLPMRSTDLDPDEKVIETAIGILSEGIERLHQLPTQLIHGDFSHPNLRVAGEQPRLIGVIDFEFCSEDPVILDLATPILTLILRSDDEKPERRIRTLVEAYEFAAEQSVELEDLLVALVGRRLDSYWYHRRRFLEGRGSSEVFERQVPQLRRLVTFVKERWKWL